MQRWWWWTADKFRESKVKDLENPNFSSGVLVRSSLEFWDDDADGCECCKSVKGAEMGRPDSAVGWTGDGPALI